MLLEPTGLLVAYTFELLVAQFLVSHLTNELGRTQQGKHCFLSFSSRFHQCAGIDSLSSFLEKQRPCYFCDLTCGAPESLSGRMLLEPTGLLVGHIVQGIVVCFLVAHLADE